MVHSYVPSQSSNHTLGYTITKLAVTLTVQTMYTVYVCGDLCYHSYKCDDMCFEYMNRKISKHLHRIHSMPIHSVEEMELDVPDVDHVSTDNTEETNETSNDPVSSHNPYSFSCTTASRTHKK